MNCLVPLSVLLPLRALATGCKASKKADVKRKKDLIKGDSQINNKYISKEILHADGTFNIPTIKVKNR